MSAAPRPTHGTSMKGYDIFYRDPATGRINRTRFSNLGNAELQKRLAAIRKKYQPLLVLRTRTVLFATFATIHKTFDIGDPLAFYYLGAEMSRHYARAGKLKKKLAETAAAQSSHARSNEIGQRIESLKAFRAKLAALRPGGALCLYFEKEGSKECARRRPLFAQVVQMLPRGPLSFAEVPWIEKDKGGTTAVFEACKVDTVPSWISFYNIAGKVQALRLGPFTDKYLLAQLSQGVRMKGDTDEDIKEVFVQYLRWLEDKLG